MDLTDMQCVVSWIMNYYNHGKYLEEEVEALGEDRILSLSQPRKRLQGRDDSMIT